MGSNAGGAYVVAAVKQRKRKALAPALARYGIRTHDALATQLATAWTPKK